MKAISKLKDDARKHEQKEEWEKAIQVYLQVLRQGDEGEGDVELPLFNRIGDLCVRLGRPLEAVKHYEEAADRYAEAGLYNNAIALCNKALRYQPTRLELLRKLGQFSASQGFLTDARRYFLEFAEKQFTAGAVDEALAALRDFADVAEDGEIRELLARRLHAHGRTDDAVAELRKAQAIHLRTGATDQAQAVAAEIAELDPAADSLPMEVDVPSSPAAGVPDDDLPGLAELELPPLTETLDTRPPVDAAADAADDVTAGSTIEGFESTDLGGDEDMGLSELADFELPGLGDETAADTTTDFDLAPIDLPDLDPAVDVGGESGIETGIETDEGTSDSFGTLEGLESTTLDFGAASDVAPLDMGLDIERDETSFDAPTDDVFELPGLDDHAPGDEPDAAPDEGGFELQSLVGDDGVPDDDFGSFGLAGSADDVTDLADVDDLADLETPGAESDAFELPTLAEAGDEYGADEPPDQPAPMEADEAVSGPGDDFGDGAMFDLPGLDEDDALDQAEDFELPRLDDGDTAVHAVAPPDLEGSADGADDFELSAPGELDADSGAAATANEDVADVHEEDELPELPTLGEPEAAAWGGDAAAGADLVAGLDGSDDDVADTAPEPAAPAEDTPVADQSTDDWLDDMAGPYGEDAAASAPADADADREHDPVDIDPDRYDTAAGAGWTPDSLTSDDEDTAGTDRDGVAASAVSDGGAMPPAEAGDAGDAGGFIDLGALLADDEAEGTRFTVQESAPTGDEDRDFAELLSQFKAKVSEHLPAEDAAAHYDLGLAFKEMGLVDEAIAEFQIALRASELRLKVYEELGDCFLKKDQYNIAEKVLRRALDVRYNDELELLGVYYHLGRAYEGMGKLDQARDAYERVLGMDINFGDVTERLARL